jgi:predicted CopG family antitoxin
MKTITIKDEIYESLKNMKEEGDSFSDVIERLINRRGFKIDDYFGILEDNEVMKEIRDYSKKARKSARSRT